MKKIIAALVAVLATPALALDYDCSPLTGGCVPRASQPSAFDSPAIYYPPQRAWPRSCPLDGPSAWTCDTRRDRERRDRTDRRR
jgi:hypothetical protein